VRFERSDRPGVDPAKKSGSELHEYKNIHYKLLIFVARIPFFFKINKGHIGNTTKYKLIFILTKILIYFVRYIHTYIHTYIYIYIYIYIR
jgi:hypothetical protein